ncbi:hypothetical protein J0H58_04355 [bacterium]|nr:hypothetical protein [bacterium]
MRVADVGVLVGLPVLEVLLVVTGGFVELLRVAVGARLGLLGLRLEDRRLPPPLDRVDGDRAAGAGDGDGEEDAQPLEAENTTHGRTSVRSKRRKGLGGPH